MRSARLTCPITATLLATVGVPAIATTAMAQSTPSQQPNVQRPGKPSPSTKRSTNTAAGENTVEQIVVTANKRRELSRQVADSVTAITGKTLDQRQQVRLQDIAAEVPGLSLEADSATAVRIVLRGLNTGSAGATVASVLDDVPTSPILAQGNAAINSPNFDTFDLNRIEVLRGPQSTLYGATAEGGIVKYVTNSPDLTRYGGEFEGGIDGITGGGLGGSMKGWGNFPLINNVLAVRVDAWNDYDPGYINDPEIGKNNSNSAQQYGYRVSVLARPTDTLTIRLLAQRESLFENNEDYIEAVGAALNPLNPPRNQLDLLGGTTDNTHFSDFSQNETGAYYADVSNDFGWSTLTSVTSYAFGDFTNLNDYSYMEAAPGVDYSQLLGAEYGVDPVFRERQNSDDDKFNQEVRLTSGPGWNVFGQKLDWLGGAYFTHENSAFLQGFDALDPSDATSVLSPAPGQDNIIARLSEWAAFGSIDYHLLRTVDLAIGGRVEGNTQYAQNTTSGILFNPANVSYPHFSTNEHDQLYSISPRWRPTEDTTVYARIATGFRPGGPNIAIAGTTVIPPPFGPDRVVNYEIGVRQDFFGKRVAVDVTGFWVDWSDVQILTTVDTAAGPFNLTGNAGRAQSKGVEWDLAYVPIRGLRLEAVGDYADARLTTDAPGLGGLAGDYLPYVPAVSASVNVDYNFHVNEKLAAYLSGTWSFTGVRFRGFAASPVILTHVELPAFNTGAIRAGLTRGRYNLEFFVDNISDSQGITFYQSSGGADNSGLLTIIQPRTIGMVGRVNF